MAFDRDSELGSLWSRTSSKGEFLSGKITIEGVEHEIILFPNSFKEPGDRKPDWRIYKSQPREGYAPAPQQQRAPQARRAPPPAADLDDEIPFVWLAPLLVPGLALLSLAGVA
jgi:hypothetical protein